MDLATILGFIGANIVIFTAIFLGGSAATFLNVPSILVVIGGTFGVTLMKFPLSHTLGAFGVAAQAFINRSRTPSELMDESLILADMARKEGVLALENIDVKNPFLKKGVQLIVDGHDAELVSKMLSTDISLTVERAEQGQAIFKAIGDVAPAMGMIGTLIGLVQMMSNMSDPKSIGPAMAVALLTTLYGAVIANAFALPIADKLAHRSREEGMSRSMVLESIRGIQDGMNPRVMEELLSTYLSDKERGKKE